jgi:hypothetical protein
MSSSEGYILNAVQTPGPLLPVYRSIARGSTTKETIRMETAIDANLEATLDGLRLLRLVGREDEAYYAEPFQWDVGSERKSFQMTALHNLVQECTPGNWGKQAAALLNYWYLLDNNRQHFRNNDSALYESIDRWYKDLGYEPRSQQGPITHNEPKFGNWTRLMEYLGLIHKVSGREHTVYPDPEMVLRSVELACEAVGTETDGSPTVEIEQYLNWLRGNLLYVELTSDGEIPAPLARVLFELIRDNHLEAREYGDAGQVGFSGVPPYDGMDKAANTLRVK